MALIDEHEEQEKLMRQMMKKQRIKKMEELIKSGDYKIMNALKRMINREDEI